MNDALNIPELVELRRAAREIFAAGLQAADPQRAIQRKVRINGSVLTVCEDEYDLGTREVYLVGLGKAVLAMAAGMAEVLEDRIARALIVASFNEKSPAGHQLLKTCSDSEAGAATQAGNFHLSPECARRWQILSGGHPLPTRESLRAGQESLRLVKEANAKRALIVFLVSGGGSAMMEWPLSADITLDDLRSANQLLINCGATIAEINTVRRTFSALKGGRLANAAPDADQISLIVSDTNPGDERQVASGPTMSQLGGSPAADEIVDRYDLRRRLPDSILKVLTSATPQLEQSAGQRKHYVLLDNNTALKAAARKANDLGYRVTVAGDILEQPVDNGTTILIERLRTIAHPGAVTCLLSGGEFACPVRGNGLGGRNLETVLRCALELSKQKAPPWRHAVVLSAGTDGIDGNSPAAGGIADNNTIARALNLGLDPSQYLEASDSFRFLQLVDSIILTGQTGTNVRDLRILLAQQ